VKYRAPIILLVVLTGGGLLWLTISRNRVPSSRSAIDPVSKMDESPQVVEDSASSRDHEVAANDDKPSATSPAAEAVPAKAKAKPIALAAAAEPPEGPQVGPGLKPLAVMENIHSVFRQYSARFGGNPVGTNPEITAALNGGNSRQVVFLQPDDGMQINERGELVDNWGTPFFFHQLSATEMEIHSAGPDRKMWTHDDLVIK
jgi:hypothetical protein